MFLIKGHYFSGTEIDSMSVIDFGVRVQRLLSDLEEQAKKQERDRQKSKNKR